MSARLEWLTPTATELTIYKAGAAASDHNTVTAPYALELGHPDGAIVEGTAEDLRALLTKALDLLDITELLQPQA